jgi:hypothetical protein
MRRATSWFVGGLSLDGRLIVPGADFTPMALNTAALIGKGSGWCSPPETDSAVSAVWHQ